MNVLAKVELAHEPDFVLGRLTVSPSRRELVRNDGEREVIEHRVMQVLIALSRAEGNIVTRDELTMSCWDGRVVGEDSIHRVLSRLRKVAKGIGAGSIEIETITKIGYRLTSSGYEVAAGPAEEGGVAALGSLRHVKWRKVAAIAVAVILAMAVGLLAWTSLSRNALPVVAIGPADTSPQSQRLARDLFVKLGTLPQLGSGRWQLIDAASSRSEPNLLFRASVTGPAAEPRTSLALLDGKDDSLLWSREFNFPASRESDLRQHVTLTAGRLLDCALEARREGGLPPDLLRLFLAGCAAMAETSQEDPQKTAGIMRAIVSAEPRFAPAWGRLLMADVNILELSSDYNDGENSPESAERLRLDIADARRVAPDLPEIMLAELSLVPRGRYADVLELVRKLKTKAPESPEVWLEEAQALSNVGRMRDAVASARRAAELDPLSPAVSSRLISLLAWAGQTERAETELGRAERLWPGTGALQDAQYAFHLRYGDPRIARRLIEGGQGGKQENAYLQARLDPSAANIDRLFTIFSRVTRRGSSRMAVGVQALGEFGDADDVFDWLRQFPPGAIADSAYVLFRPGLAEVRRDTRFMREAKRIGLTDYWETSGQWPDFCFDPALPYDCREEAARLKS